MVGVPITPIVAEDPTLITDFDDFCLYVYCIVDEIYQQLAPQWQRPGPAPTTVSDSELIALAIIGECRGWDIETELLGHAHTFRGLCTRLHTKLAAHTLWIYLNRFLGNADFLQ